MSDTGLKVNPQIMAWAREERGFAVSEVASKLKKDATVIEEWERSGEGISFSELKHIAQIYKRQISVFFLDDIPRKVIVPEDKRNMSVEEKDLSPETLLAIRRTSRYLEVSRELNEAEEIASQYGWLDRLSNKSPKEIVRVMRE